MVFILIYICFPADGSINTETNYIILTAAIPRYASWLVSIIHPKYSK